jgi:hypothetical protein
MKPDRKYFNSNSKYIIPGKPNTHLNILVYFLIISFLTFSFLTRVQPVFAVEPSLLFSPETENVKSGETFDIDLLIDTAGQQVGGVDAVVKYNPSLLSGASIQTTGVFNDYPATIINNQDGQINISGIVNSINNLYAGRDTFAVITFKAVSQGTAIVNFHYLPGSTRDSNIAVTFGSGDILNRVNSLTVSIQGTATGGAVDTENGTSNGASLSTTPIVRPTSQFLDPHQPIPSQSSITDPSQEQPTEVAEEMTFESTKPPISSTSRTLIVAGILLTATISGGVIIWILRRRKNDTSSLPPVPPSPPQQPLPN